MQARVRAAHLLLTAVAAASVTCGGGNPVGPAATDTAGAGLRIVSDPVITLEAGATLALAIEERDAAGRPLATSAASYAWSSSRPELLSADDGVLRSGEGFGQAIVTATSANGLSTSVRVWVQPRPGAAPPFRLTLEFADGVPAFWRAEFTAAALQWEQLIHAALPAVSLDNPTHACGTPPGQPPLPALTGTESGTRVYVGLGKFPPGTYTEAVGGPCLQRALPYPTTIFGAISVNPDKFGETIEPGRRKYVALHELGHTLGLVGVVQGLQPDWLEGGRDVYRGPLGLEGYRRQFGITTSSLTNAGAHWPFSGDVMGNSGGSVSVGTATLGALMDHGYPVRW